MRLLLTISTGVFLTTYSPMMHPPEVPSFVALSKALSLSPPVRPNRLQCSRPVTSHPSSEAANGVHLKEAGHVGEI
ncbi:hypothetical protein V5799_024028 [Amblyomma americanum]|uniref:Uncharacterized protein n=1 Tax=Amblyomma americanum TaxID=6943 RepID=A0AAQ4EDP9_AMBAM